MIKNSKFSIPPMLDVAEIIKRIQYLEQNGLQKLIKAFEKVFNKGYKNEKQRLSSSDWRNILYEICVWY